MAATKPTILMLMITSLFCGFLAILLAFLIGISLIIAIPGIIVGAFFAFKYAMYDRNRAVKGEPFDEDQKNRRKRRNR
ncbi:MAG TPA: hypothetical protein VHF28_05000 [Nitrososphaera sp.]|nr:hypothetical protein [Nitrososphaera sp.]